MIEWLKAGREQDAMEADFMRKRVIELEHGGKAEGSEAGCGNRQRPASPLGDPPQKYIYRCNSVLTCVHIWRLCS